MVKPKDEFPARTFVKTDRDGNELTRIVTRPDTEVAARFDGYVEKPAAKASASTTASRPASTSS